MTALIKGKLLGHGHFSKVYEVDNKTVLFETECMAKYCYAEWLGKDRFYPDIWKDDDHNLLGKKYIKITAPKQQLKALHYRMYLTLRNLDCYGKCYVGIYREFEKIIFKPLREALINALDGMCNYIECDDIRFEISPRNIMTDNKGNMILNDIFFCLALLNKKRTA